METNGRVSWIDSYWNGLDHLTFAVLSGLVVKQKAFKGITDRATQAMKELLDLSYVVRDLAVRINYDEHCMQERNKRKCDLPPITKKLFNDAALYFLGKSALCDSVDIYNSYCQDVLQLAVRNNRAAVPLALATAKRFGDGLKKAAKNKTDPAMALLDMFRSGYIADAHVRAAIHSHLGIDQFPETELICLCRNILVHRRGSDPDGEIAAKLKEVGPARAFIGAQGFPDGHLPIAVDASMRLIVDDQVGLWVAGILTQQIHLMDQHLSAKYPVPTAPLPKLSIGRIFVTDNM